MNEFVGFSEKDVEVVKKLVSEFNICVEPTIPVRIETNNNENDTILFGEYSIIKDEDGHQAYYTKNAYSWEHGPECVEVKQGSLSPSFYGALRQCALCDFELKMNGLYRSLILPQEDVLDV